MAEILKVLVTGATGFIGKRLIAALLDQGAHVYALIRIKGTLVFPDADNPLYANLKIIYGDLRNPEALNDLPAEIDAAYYLMHSMSEIMSNLESIETSVARNFVAALKKTKVKQILYLGGIIRENALSEHMRSRLKVENVLKESGISYTILRASIIVGAGSASFEIIRDLVEVLPIMIAPRWVQSRCQPIAIRDVIFYLKEVLLNQNCMNRTFEIGGPEILTFKEVLMQYAEVRGLKRKIISVPVLTPKLSSYWLVFVTSVRFSIAQYLVESMKADSFVTDPSIKSIVPHDCITYKEAIQLALAKVSQNEVTSSWTDSWEIQSVDPDIQKFIEVPKEGVLSDRRVVPIKGSQDKVIENIWSIGGSKGWYGYDSLWELRGLMDKMVGGVGLNRGRRDPHNIVVGDAIDFWRVIKADKQEKHLILYAEMKVPGEAWLEFLIKDTDNGPELIQTATFRPKGVLGRLYWYLFLPFHYFIFRGMARNIAQP